MTFALIQHGRVHELFAADPKLHPDLDVRDVSAVAGIAEDWLAQPDGSFSPPLPPERDLAAVKGSLKQTVDERAEALRLKLITPGSGQAMEYVEAQRQAQAALSDADPTVEKYPMLAASIGLDSDPQTGEAAIDVVGVARSITAARDAWNRAGAAIRSVRLTAKAAIDEAGTIEAAEAALDAVVWPAFG